MYLCRTSSVGGGDTSSLKPRYQDVRGHHLSSLKRTYQGEGEGEGDEQAEAEGDANRFKRTTSNRDQVTSSSTPPTQQLKASYTSNILHE